MKGYIELNREGHWHIKQKEPGWFRYLIGIPSLGFGLLLLYGFFPSAIRAIRGEVSDGAGNAIAGLAVVLLFIALTLPLGWWLVFSRHWITLDTTNLEIIETSDWRLGQSSKRTPFSAFQKVRVATETLSPSSNNKQRVDVLVIRLLAKDPLEQPSVRVGWFERNQQETAREFAQQISTILNLPLEVFDEDVILPTPEEELANMEDDEDELAEDEIRNSK